MAEREVLASTPGFPLDEFVMIRDRLWYGAPSDNGDPCRPTSLVSYLRRLASDYVDVQGRPFQQSDDYSDKGGRSPAARLRWSWLCRALPPDLILSARNPDKVSFPSFPLNPPVQRLLDEKGFAEPHLHLGAAADFSLLWANLMHHFEVEEFQEGSCESPGACFNDGRNLAKWVLWAAIARLVLAEWMFSVSRAQKDSMVLDFDNVNWRWRMDAGMINDLYRLLSELSSGREGIRPVQFDRAKNLYRALIRPSRFPQSHQDEYNRLRARHKPQTRQEVFQNDPLATIVGWDDTEVNGAESIFIKRSLAVIEAEGKHGDFARLFWQVNRIRCLLYRHLVFRPLTPGLQWFVRFFSRISPVRGTLSDRVLMESAIEQSGVRNGLKAIEVRLGTEESEAECMEKLRLVDEVNYSTNTLEVGAVFHFSRDRGGGWKKGVPNAYGLDHSYPGTPPCEYLRTRNDVGNPTGFRFAQFYLDRRRHAQALVNVLQGVPLLLRTFRGVDLCTDEAGVPMWVMAPLVRWVRETGREGIIRLDDEEATGVLSPRTTVHAGEDFIHLLTGLRRLDDAIQYLSLEEGDRIGHGLSLGLDPIAWCERVGRIVQPREERLFDLVWEWTCYANQGVSVDSTRLAYLESSITRLSRQMFGESKAPDDIAQFIKYLHSEHELKDLGFPDGLITQMQTSSGKSGLVNKSRHLLHEYLCSKQVWENGRVLETVAFIDLEHELSALCCLQRSLRKKVGKMGLIVEVNPSSNLMIAGLGILDEHPIWRLSQPLDDIPPLSVCIGSDDPLTFATNLSQEYQLLFDAMVLAGRSHEDALSWLENCRETGMRGRFTLPRSFTGYTRDLRPTLFEVRRSVPPP